MAKSKSEKPKKTAIEQNYLFPDAIINGKQGITISATSQDEAEAKLNKILNVKSND